MHYVVTWVIGDKTNPKVTQLYLADERNFKPKIVSLYSELVYKVNM